MDSTSQSAADNYEVPHLPSSGGVPGSGSVLFLSLGTPVILFLAVGRVAALATGQLLCVLGYRATAVAPCVCLIVTLFKG